MEMELLEYEIETTKGSYIKSLDLEEDTDNIAWESPPHSAFPQVIKVNFKRNVCIDRIQILSHEYKIAEKVVLHSIVSGRQVKLGYCPGSHSKLCLF